MNGHTLARQARRRRAGGPALLFAATLASAAALGIVLYVVNASLPFLASVPTTDPLFGRANQCLIGALSTPRVGNAVSWSGNTVAGWAGDGLALCDRDGGVQRFPILGVQAAAFDLPGTLWLATGEVPDAGFRLGYLGPDGGFAVAGDFAAIALAGHKTGAVALDAAGKLVSVTRDGEVLGLAQLPAAPAGPVQLSVDAAGDLAAVVTSGGMFAFRTADLSRIRGESPCAVDYLWWQRQGDGAILSCGPQDGFALNLAVESGEREAAPRKERIRSVLVAGLGVYTQPCEHLPCSAPPP